MKSEKFTNLKLSTDLELVQELKKSNPNAFTFLYGRSKYRSFNFAYTKLNDKEVTRNLIHNVFTSLWDNHSNINIQGIFPKYIYIMVHSKIIHYFRRTLVAERYQKNLGLLLQK